MGVTAMMMSDSHELWCAPCERATLRPGDRLVVGPVILERRPVPFPCAQDCVCTRIRVTLTRWRDETGGAWTWWLADEEGWREAYVFARHLERLSSSAHAGSGVGSCIYSEVMTGTGYEPAHDEMRARLAARRRSHR